MPFRKVSTATADDINPSLLSLDRTTTANTEELEKSLEASIAVLTRQLDALNNRANQMQSQIDNQATEISSVTQAVENLPADIYRVGATYLTIGNEDPNNFLPGSWEKIKDRYLLASGDSVGAGTTGGSNSITVGINNMPSHRHNFEIDYPPGRAGEEVVSVCGRRMSGSSGVEGSSLQLQSGNASSAADGQINIKSQGSGVPIAIKPEYIAVNMWVRRS